MKFFRNALAIILFFFFTLPAWGSATLGIYPVRVDLTPDKKIGEVTIRNKGENEVKAQIYAKTWDMDENGKFIETDTGDFVFFPRLLTIPGGEDKVLRVGYNGDFPPIEKPYRLYIQELPEIKTSKQETTKMNTSFNFLLKLSVPVFVRPSNDPEPIQAEILGIAPEEGDLKIKLRNAGTRTFMLKKISAQLKSQNGPVIDGFEDDYTQRVLPKRSLFLKIPLKNSACDKAKELFLKLSVFDSNSTLMQTITLNPGCTMASGGIPLAAE